ncbi:MAG: sigma-70 family RNA polymerase sigma factor [Candidatus Eremiobacteraeota bacterium]|nr:sigma-70 family RNA polymerase sigma factor [Candidatus Eremiobacteraeota bacterium]
MGDREAAIRSFLPLVKKIARRIKRLVPLLDADDLIGDGSVGLIRAIDSYDPTRGPSLRHYARRLIVGAMLNGIRRMDPVSERARRIVRDGENKRYAVAAARGDVPSTAEMERQCPGLARALAATHRGQPLSLDAPLPEGERVVLDWGDDPARIVEQRHHREAFAMLIDGLPLRQRHVVLEHYFRGRSLHAIGRAMKISPQRASQLHRDAIAGLRRRMHASPP